MIMLHWFQQYEDIFWIILKIAIVIGAGALVNFLIRSLVTSYFKRESSHINVDPTAFSFIKNAFTFIMFIITIFIVIYMIPAFKHIATTLFAGAGVVAAIVGFASQAAFSNIINGVFLVIFKPFRIGDFIEIRKQDEYTGRVEDITLRHTVIKNGENKRIIVPNSVISSEIIVNRSLVDEKVVRYLDIQVGYTTDLDHAMNVIRDECGKHPLFRDPRSQLQIEANEEKVEVRVLKFGDFGIQLRANICGETSPESSILVSDLYKSLKKRFEQEGIEIPYPYTNVVLKNSAEKNV